MNVVLNRLIAITSVENHVSSLFQVREALYTKPLSCCCCTRALLKVSTEANLQEEMKCPRFSCIFRLHCLLSNSLTKSMVWMGVAACLPMAKNMEMCVQ